MRAAKESLSAKGLQGPEEAIMLHSIGRVFLAIIMICSVAGAVGATRSANACDTAHPLPLNGTVRMDGLDVGETASFSVEVPEPGLLTVEVNTPGFENEIPWIDLEYDDCLREEAGRLQALILRRSLGRQILEVMTPGTYDFRVGILALDRRLGSYTLSVRFQALEWPEPGKVPGQVDDENLPYKDGEPGDDTEEVDNEILPFGSGPIPGCVGAGEPANDLSLCASHLPPFGVVDGQLEIGSGWDHDYFVFVLPRLSRVRLFTTGTTDTFGTLYDAYGHRLMAADHGGGDQNFSLVASLAPGRYYVRVEGALGAEGSYHLALSLEP